MPPRKIDEVQAHNGYDHFLQQYSAQMVATGQGYMPKIMKHVLDALADLGESEQVALFSIPDPNVSICQVDGGFSNGQFIAPGRLIHFEGTPFEQLVKAKESNTYPGILIDNIPFPANPEIQSDFECLCMPLLNEEQKFMGIAVLAQKKGFSITDFRMRTLIMLRTLISAAMENARLFQMATTDSLTGLYLRRYFEIRLQEEIVRVGRHGGHVAVVMIDIDFFKKVNDTYGHQQGDLVLQSIARIILDSIRRDIDFPCRFGGEEFVLLLPNTPSEGAGILAERIRQRCAEKNIELPQQQTLHITISLGVADMSKDNLIGKNELVRRADAMLYEAKRSGRNQVVIYHPELE